MYVWYIHAVPVSIPNTRPKASRTATVSLASMVSQAMAMMNAASPSPAWRAQCGGEDELSRKKRRLERRMPVCVCVCVCVCIWC